MLPVAIWAFVRYSYDGLTFFQGMLMQEVVDRVEKEKDYFAYLEYFGTNPAVILGAAAGMLAIVFFYIFQKDRESESRGICIKKIINHDLYLFLLWLIVPLAVYSASGSFMEWYGYICYLPFCVIVAALVTKTLSVKGRMRRAGIVLALLPVIGLCISGKQEIVNLKTLIWENNTDIRADLSTLIERYPEYIGSRIYIENSRNEYRPQNVWEQNCVVDAYIIGDLQPADGGVPLFVEEEESILIISKDLFETYSNLLAGRVILVDGNDYLIFCNEFYS